MFHAVIGRLELTKRNSTVNIIHCVHCKTAVDTMDNNCNWKNSVNQKKLFQNMYCYIDMIIYHLSM